jgi:excisionase family DNA binding protein
MKNPPRQLVTIAAAAEQLGICTRTIHRRIADGSLRVYRVGPRLLRVDQTDLDKLIRPVLTVRDTEFGATEWRPRRRA